ncbi:rod shape-determining protein RodA [Janthinobacterium aquaticum]|uniref:rod shape-determining protein RodA n=1 Tax=Janthinobacterium sp. FT58W TaxID=2654254 RepID=UPI0012659579|nr:rod shape-determining protein RodA [Janthinobacterium sp. FT58W]KAB8043112.1 rod shape-determining protein RodA [Janthinobacterium sp. FT58W]
MSINERRSLWRRAKPYLTVFDGPLLVIIMMLFATSLVTLYSASIGIPGKIEDHLRNIALCFFVMWVAANITPQMMMRIAVPAYTISVMLLIAVALFGTIKLGARRWLHIGVIDIQPSEFLKIAAPLMLAWFFQHNAGTLRWQSFLIAAVLLFAPVYLIARQPDLGTSLLVVAAGFTVIFLAGLSWRVMLGVVLAVACYAPIAWSHMHDYQRDRVMMLIDPTKDPLGKGFHIIQSIIGIGSGGMTGKGWTHGTQAHLDFVPERTTDFIFAVYSEEFGLIGNLILMLMYLLLIGRGMMIAANAPNFFTRLFAGAITMIFFTYAFVNMGMVSGIVPVVGVPLPFLSYGGTALLTLGIASGLLMSIQRHRKLVQT